MSPFTDTMEKVGHLVGSGVGFVVMGSTAVKAITGVTTDVTRT